MTKLILAKTHNTVKGDNIDISQDVAYANELKRKDVEYDWDELVALGVTNPSGTISRRNFI